MRILRCRLDGVNIRSPGAVHGEEHRQRATDTASAMPPQTIGRRGGIASCAGLRVGRELETRLRQPVVDSAHREAQHAS